MLSALYWSPAAAAVCMLSVCTVRGQALLTQVCVCMSQAPEELFEVTAQCLMSGQDRDALSGWGAIIHVM